MKEAESKRDGSGQRCRKVFGNVKISADAAAVLGDKDEKESLVECATLSSN